MKLYKIGLLALVLALTSCQDFLDLKPKNKIVMNTLEDVRSMVAAYLYSMGGNGTTPVTFNGQQIAWPFTKSINLGFTMYSNEMEMVRFPTTTYGKGFSKVYYENVDWKGITLGQQIWVNFYTHIGYLNEAIVALEDLKGENKIAWQKVMGEVKTIRAWYILKLLEYFCTYNDNNWGIPLNLDPDQITGGKCRKQTEIYEQIIGDLTEALNYEARPDEWNMFYRKEIINLILAHTYWFKATSAAADSKDWENAAKYSANVLTIKDELETTSNQLKTEFAGNCTTPYIKDNPYAFLKLASKLTASSGNADAPFYANANSGQRPTDEFYNSFDAGDIRLGAFFGKTKISGEDVPYIYKYTRSWPFTGEFAVLFRVAEAYLICAEANAHLGNSVAKDLLETFKKSRIPGYINYDGNSILEEILKERRKEFCYEMDFNWLDMKRRNQKSERDGLDAKTGEAAKFTLESKDYRYALCIPLEEELSYNPDITNNPGWN